MGASEDNQIKALQAALQGEAPVLVFPSGERYQLPPSVHQLFKQLVEKLADGRVVTLTGGERALSTQQAADILGISRPTFVKLLGTSAMPYHHAGPGKHRRVLLRDLLDYAQARSMRSPMLTELLGDTPLKWG